MATRFKNALIVQGGASNRRKVAAVLLEAIDEVRAENGSTEEDPAIFLILHQLTFLLSGHDIACAADYLNGRWEKATRACEEHEKAVTP